MGTIVNGKHNFELVDIPPLGYFVWNIGKNMQEGYLPLCRMKQGSNFEVDTQSLRAYPMEGAQDILAAIDGFTDCPIQKLAEKMKDYLLHNKPNGPTAFQFSSAQEMLDKLADTDLYNPITGTYVFLYNDSGSIAAYRGIDTDEANRLTGLAQKNGENMWSAMLGPGGLIYDDPSYEHYDACGISNLEYCETQFQECGWFSTNDWPNVSWDALHAERIKKAIPHLEQLRF